MDQFLQEFFMRRGKPENWEQNASHWHHLTAWYPLRHNPDVLWLHFEDLKVPPKSRIC